MTQCLKIHSLNYRIPVFPLVFLPFSLFGLRLTITLEELALEFLTSIVIYEAIYVYETLVFLVLP